MKEKFWQAVEEEIDRQLLAIQQKSVSDIVALSQTEAHDLGECRVAGRQVVLTLFPYNQAGTVLIIVQASVKAALGLAHRSIERGIVVSADGAVRDATEEEVIDAS